VFWNSYRRGTSKSRNSHPCFNGRHLIYTSYNRQQTDYIYVNGPPESPYFAVSCDNSYSLFKFTALSWLHLIIMEPHSHNVSITQLIWSNINQ
jgi:hypothetical protein